MDHPRTRTRTCRTRSATKRRSAGEPPRRASRRPTRLLPPPPSPPPNPGDVTKDRLTRSSGLPAAAAAAAAAAAVAAVAHCAGVLAGTGRPTPYSPPLLLPPLLPLLPSLAPKTGGLVSGRESNGAGRRPRSESAWIRRRGGADAIVRVKVDGASAARLLRGRGAVRTVGEGGCAACRWRMSWAEPAVRDLDWVFKLSAQRLS